MILLGTVPGNQIRPICVIMVQIHLFNHRTVVAPEFSQITGFHFPSSQTGCRIHRLRQITAETILCIFVSTHEIGHISCFLHAIVTIVTDSCFSRTGSTFALLRSNHDHTICGTRTVDSSRRSIFQYVHLLYIHRIQEIHVVAYYSVDNIQRLAIFVHRTLSTNLNIKSVARTARRLGNIYTGNLSLQTLHY